MSEVRRARHEERQALAELMLGSRLAADIPPLAHSEQELREWVCGQLISSYEVWIAADDDLPVAMIALGGNCIEQLYVSPPDQRRGHGARLLELAKAQRDELTLWTFASNQAAQRFYETHGFSRSGPDSDANEERAPAIPYRWRRAR